VVAAVTIISISLAVFLPVPYHYGFFITYWPLFALGVALFYSLKNNYSLASLPRLPALFLSSAILGTITLFVAQAAVDDHLKQWNLLGFGGGWMSFAFLSALALWGMAPLDPDLRKAASGSQWVLAFPLRVGVFLGVISYSLYLLHPKVYQVWDKVSKLLSMQQGPAYPILLIVGTIGFSYLFYLACEKPFIHGGRLYKKIARTG
jgi:peptidoglycan/LPS O-acetylase OafA/YrhL